jgi:4'-phosphopantetheinyl transferase
MHRWEPAPRQPSLGAGEVLVFRLRLAAALADEAVLSQEERARAARFRFERDRARFVATRAALRQLLAAHLGQAPAALTFAAGPQGKPRLAGLAGERLRFNVSHSGDVALLALALDGEVGADVEQHRPETDVDALAPTVFTARELSAYRDLDARVRRAAFFGLWAGKEAVLKALGSGLSVSPRRVELLPVPWRAPCRLRVEGVAGATYEVCPIDAGPDLSGAVACAAEAPALRLYELAAT